MLQGFITAQITPFNDDHSINWQLLEDLLNRQLYAGINGLVIAGSTGEAMSMTNAEKLDLVKKAARVINKKVPLIAGASAYSAKETAQLLNLSANMGADYGLCLPPHYIKPSQDAIYEYFKYIHANSTTPIILYSNPGRSGVEISVDTVIRLAKECGRIVAIKDCGPITRAIEISTGLRNIGRLDFVQLSGDDSTFVGHMAYGGKGCVSVMSNLDPNLCASFYKSNTQDNEPVNTNLSDMTKERLYKLAQIIGMAGNPMTIKLAMAHRKLCDNIVRPPLLPITQPEMVLQLTKKITDFYASHGHNPYASNTPRSA